jgi:hypothetical protein
MPVGVGGVHVQKLVGEELCAARKKPRDERSCHIQACKEQWFTTAWSQVQELFIGEMVTLTYQL